MPLKFSWKKLPVDENGKSYDSLEAFQVAKIRDLFPAVTNEIELPQYQQAAVILVEKKEQALEILQLNTSARPAARGVKKPRKSKPDTQLALKENAA